MAELQLNLGLTLNLFSQCLHNPSNEGDAGGKGRSRVLLLGRPVGLRSKEVKGFLKDTQQSRSSK